MKNYYTYGITCVVAWLPAAVSARSLRCFGLVGGTMRWTDKAFNGIRARSGTSG